MYPNKQGNVVEILDGACIWVTLGILYVGFNSWFAVITVFGGLFNDGSYNVGSKYSGSGNACYTSIACSTLRMCSVREGFALCYFMHAT